MVESFGVTASGREVHRVTLQDGPLAARVITFGGALQDVRLEGLPHSLTVGSPDISAYEGPLAHCGTIMGPVANRIAGARATIDGIECRFERNFLNAHTLHGGGGAFHERVWELVDHSGRHATLVLVAPDGEGGFPGTRRVEARFEIADRTLSLTLTARTDAPTILNLANHSYWRLGKAPTTRNHKLQIHADRYLPSDPDTTIPTGEISDVAGTRFDFRDGRVLNDGADGLLDTNFCISASRQPLREVARLTGPDATMVMASTEPGLQAFDGHILACPDQRTNDGVAPVSYCGLALEAQFWPNAPHEPGFPDITLYPGQNWRQVTTWTFET
ncbi:MAG: galactose mutarotase [Boseongicola sp. SB0675_bin_26]|nr:galactose mutarotase [Boseongicola sp. SB0675_bin_26]